MRRGLWLLILVAALASSTMASSAFNYSSVQRSVSLAIVGDSAAYVKVTEVDGPHACFVDDSSSVIVISFGAVSGCTGGGAGTGINRGDGSDTARYSRYAFHDLLQITNKAPTSLTLWVNGTSTTSGSAQSEVHVALETALLQMTDGDYSASATRPSSDFDPGESVYLGVRVKSGTLSSGSLSGSIVVEARA